MNSAIQKHHNCPVRIVIKSFGPHKAALFCDRHNKWMQWLSLTEANKMLKVMK